MISKRCIFNNTRLATSTRRFDFWKTTYENIIYIYIYNARTSMEGVILKTPSVNENRQHFTANVLWVSFIIIAKYI